MSSRKQQGLTMISGLVVLVIMATLFSAAFKLGPLYLDNYFIKASIDSLHKDNVGEMTNADIRRKMANHFLINNIRDVKAKQLKIVREKKRILVSLNYEKRVNFMGNLDFVVTFTNVYDSSMGL